MSETHFFSITADKRWSVVAQDPGNWRIGIYRPEYRSENEIMELERHSCPELFICAEGEMGIIVKSGDTEEIRIMKPGDVVMVYDYHNGFCASEKGYFIVAERTSFSTDFIGRESGLFLRKEDL